MKTMSPLRLVGKPDDAAQDTSAGTIERSADGTVIIHTTVVQVAPDALIPAPFDLEKRAAAWLVRTEKLRTVKIGRRVYARRSDVLALVETLAIAKPANDAPEDTYAAVVARARRSR